MWAHYGEKHTGVVISINTSIEKWGGFNFFQIKYTNERISISSSNEQMGNSRLGQKWKEDLICSKASCWAYEKEWRYIKYKKHCCYDTENDIYYEPINEEVIDAIILGCQIKLEDKKSLIEHCKTNRLPIKIFQIVPDRHEHLLEC